MRNGGFARVAALGAILAVLLSGGRVARAQGLELAPGAGGFVKIEARFVDRTSGAEAGWGATGQILLPPQPGDPELLRWRQARAVATSLSRQSVSLPRGGRGLIRVGRDIPFAGWFLRHGIRAGWLETGTEWREVESALEVEAWSPTGDGAVRLVLAPEFSYLGGRSRRSVAFPDGRAEIVLPVGVEIRLAPPPALEAFYQRLLAGYDPFRRVAPIDLILRADLTDGP
jgi:hypothetical protein